MCGVLNPVGPITAAKLRVPGRLTHTSAPRAWQRTPQMQTIRVRVLRVRPLTRPLSRDAFKRPSPPLLPHEQQHEFEELQRVAQAPLSSPQSSRTDADLALHPDARRPVKSDFEGDTNPLTGEQGGPKTEPVGKWIEGDWSFKGRVSDF